METHGLVAEPIESRVIEPEVHKAARYDVVVSLQGPVSAYLPKQPFRSVFLDWDVGMPPEGLSETETNQRYDELYREITVRVRDLMETLRGEEAD